MTDSSGLLSRILPFVYAAIAIVAVWQLALILTGADPAILPPPLLTGETFVEMVASGEIFEHAGMSLGRVFVAWLMAACVAIPLGLAMGRFRMFERMLDPVVELFRPISPLAWIPMAIIWFGIGEGGEIFVIFIATFFPTILNPHIPRHRLFRHPFLPGYPVLDPAAVFVQGRRGYVEDLDVGGELDLVALVNQ